MRLFSTNAFVWVLLGGAFLAPSTANAVVIDTTTNTGWSNALNSNAANTSTKNFGTFTATLSSSPGNTNSDTAGPNCATVSGLSCSFDGVGIGTNDDEITVGGTETLTMNFSVAQSIVGFSVLDLFGPGDTDDALAETARARFFSGANGSGTNLGTRTIVSTFKNDTLGYQSLSFAAIGGVLSIVFDTLTPANSDFALASVVTPIPGAFLLFGSALAGLGWIRRRRPDQALEGAIV